MIDENYSGQTIGPPRVRPWSVIAAAGVLVYGVADGQLYARPPVPFRLYTITQPTHPTVPPVVDRTDMSGEDVSLRGGDLTVTSAGDWGVVTGVLAARQSIERESVASPGDFVRRPTWGMGIRDALMRGAARAVRDRQAAAVRRRLNENPRIDRTESVDVSQRTDLAAGTVTVTIVAVAKGTNVPFSAALTPQRGK